MVLELSRGYQTIRLCVCYVVVLFHFQCHNVFHMWCVREHVDRLYCRHFVFCIKQL